ncbi:MAG: ParB/RepB/Spo0J family partition protein [Clostridia bacterium]|nr:ParB/RepB/Spo0J family partition protein [Clostridia bacterium]
MAKKMGLGRGLDALLPEFEEQETGIREIPVSEIDRNPQQPRRSFDEESLKGLSESIRESGVLNPLLVIQTGKRYRLVAGERRLRASLMAGLQTVPCIVRDFSRQQEMEAALVENLQREDLNPIEEAEGIRALMDECGYTQEQAAERLGKSRPAIANSLRLLTLEDEITAEVRAGNLSAGHARVLAGIHDADARKALFRKAMNEHLNVRQLELLAADVAAGVPITPKQKVPKALSLELKDMQERLRSAVGVRRVAIQGGDKRGKVILSYRNAEELDLIYAALEKLEGR